MKPVWMLLSAMVWAWGLLAHAFVPIPLQEGGIRVGAKPSIAFFGDPFLQGVGFLELRLSKWVELGVAASLERAFSDGSRLLSEGIVQIRFLQELTDDVIAGVELGLGYGHELLPTDLEKGGAAVC